MHAITLISFPNKSKVFWSIPILSLMWAYVPLQYARSFSYRIHFAHRILSFTSFWLDTLQHTQGKEKSVHLTTWVILNRRNRHPFSSANEHGSPEKICVSTGHDTLSVTIEITPCTVTSRVLPGEEIEEDSNPESRIIDNYKNSHSDNNSNLEIFTSESNKSMPNNVNWKTISLSIELTSQTLRLF